MVSRLKDPDTFWRAPKRPAPNVDMSRLGASIRGIGPVHWQEGMLFRGARDRLLEDMTGTFPATGARGRRTHPVFVLSVQPVGIRVCPCSTKPWTARRCIRPGCPLEITGTVTDRTSYLVEECAFLLPKDPAFWRGLRFVGRVPCSCIQQVDRP